MARSLFAHFRITAGSGSGTTVVAARAGRRSIVLRAETATAYVTFDGTTPSATNGIPILTTDPPLKLTRDDGAPTLIVIAFSAGANAVVSGFETYL